MSREKGPEYLQGETKRRLDVVAGTIAGVALSPVVLGTSLVCAVDTRTLNPYFQQTRVGFDGALFDIWKIRTLKKALTEHTTETYGTFDPRASAIGSRIREFGLDETAQLLNVLGGTMSMVGIRPLLEVDFERMEDHDSILFQDWQAVYKGSKPGLTGPGQLYRHHFRESSPLVYTDSMRMDIAYAENATLGHDLAILARTPLKMFEANLHTIENASVAEPVKSNTGT